MRSGLETRNSNHQQLGGGMSEYHEKENPGMVTYYLKKCPYCGETLRAEAIICRYCNRDLRNENSLGAGYILIALLFPVVAGWIVLAWSSKKENAWKVKSLSRTALLSVLAWSVIVLLVSHLFQ